MGRPINTRIKQTSNAHFEMQEQALQQQQTSAMSRLVVLHGDVNEFSISQAIAQFLQLAEIDPVAPIQLMISTYGGSVDEMFALYDVIKCLPCPVYTYAVGKVMSAGVLLFSAGEKGFRSISPNTRFMIHPVSSGAMGNVLELEMHAKENRRLQELLEELLCAESKLTRKKLDALMKKGHDYYLNADDVIKFGIADKLLHAQK